MSHAKQRLADRKRILKKAETGPISAAEARFLMAQLPPKGHHRQNKYGAKQVTVDGHKFPSMLEAQRYQQLRYLERAGDIEHLALQPRFVLTVNGVEVGSYVADFQYFEMVRGRKRLIVDDTKGMVLPLYALKRKMFLQLYPTIIFREIGANGRCTERDNEKGEQHACGV